MEKSRRLRGTMLHLEIPYLSQGHVSLHTAVNFIVWLYFGLTALFDRPGTEVSCYARNRHKLLTNATRTPSIVITKAR